MRRQAYFLLPLVLLSVALCWVSCRKDKLPGFEPTAEVAFAGRITDEQNQPVVDAAVRAGGALAKTDANGMFRLSATRQPARDAKITVTKIGYFEFTRTYVVQDGATKIVDIQLLTRTQVGTFQAAQGGPLSVPGGASLHFPAGAVARSSGGAYNGVVQVYAHYLDPTAPELRRQMPGDLRAINAGGEEQILTSYGMLGVELSTPGGEALQIAAGQQVALSWPIQVDQQASAPAEIPLWWFDAEQSRWIEEGRAEKMGNFYVGQVQHFTWWNCDITGPLVQLSGSVFLGDEQYPLVNVYVWICPTDMTIGWGCGHGTTDSEGAFGGGVPQGQPLSLRIVNECGEIIYTQDIGSFDVDGVLPPIILPAGPAGNQTITGRLLNCFQQPVTNGYARIRLLNGGDYFALTNSSGEFSHLFDCQLAPGELEVVGYDLTAANQTTPEIFNIAALPIDLGGREVCNSLTEFIHYVRDGQATLFTDPSASYAGAPNTWVYAVSNNDFINFGFENNGQTGTYPFTYFANNTDSLGTSNTITTTLTEFGGIGEPIIGTFSGTYEDFTGASHTVSGNYRILRDE